METTKHPKIANESDACLPPLELACRHQAPFEAFKGYSWRCSIGPFSRRACCKCRPEEPAEDLGLIQSNIYCLRRLAEREPDWQYTYEVSQRMTCVTSRKTYICLDTWALVDL